MLISIDTHITCDPHIRICSGMFICLIRFYTSHQQSFSYEGMGIPGLNQLLSSDINGSALLSVTVHNQSFLNPYFSAKYGLILLRSFILK